MATGVQAVVRGVSGTRPPPAATLIRLPDGRRVAFADFGDPTGRPLVVAHGTPGSRDQVALLDAPANAAGIRVIAPDRPGYGASDFQAHRRLEDWPRDVEAIADHLGIDRFGIMGVSGGAPHAIACAAVLGQRITDVRIVSGVAPPDCWAGSSRPAGLEKLLGALMRHAGWLFALLAAPLFWFARRLPHLFLRIYRRILPEADREILTRPEVAAAYRDEIRRLPRTAVAAVVQDLALFAGPWGPLVDRVDQPTTVWHGGKDRAVPIEHAIAVSERLANARITVFPADGHLMLCDRAAAILGGSRTPPPGPPERPLSEVQ